MYRCKLDHHILHERKIEQKFSYSITWDFLSFRFQGQRNTSNFLRLHLLLDTYKPYAFLIGEYLSHTVFPDAWLTPGLDYLQWGKHCIRKNLIFTKTFYSFSLPPSHKYFSFRTTYISFSSLITSADLKKKCNRISILKRIESKTFLKTVFFILKIKRQ